MLDRCQALGMAGRLVVSHAFCLGAPDARRLDGLLTRLAALDVALLTTAPPSRPVPSVRPPRGGVTIFGGNDGIRDTWSPYGEPDMLARAMLIGMRNDLRRDEEIGWALECVTTSAARACGFADYGLAGRARRPGAGGRELRGRGRGQRAPRRLVLTGGVVAARLGGDAAS